MSLIKEIQKDLLNSEEFEKEFVNNLIKKYGWNYTYQMETYYKLFVKKIFENKYNIQENTKFKITFESEKNGKITCNYINYKMVWDNEVKAALIQLNEDNQMYYSYLHLHFNPKKFVYYNKHIKYIIKDIIQIE